VFYSALQCVAVLISCAAAGHLQHVAVWCSVLNCAAVGCSGLQWVAVFCNVLQCVAVSCIVLQCLFHVQLLGAFNHVGVCCGVLQCVAVCCSVLQCVAVYCSALHFSRVDTGRLQLCRCALQCAALYCSVMQCLSVCCSVCTYMPHTASQCYTLQYTATQGHTSLHSYIHTHMLHTVTHSNTLQHTATHGNTRLLTATLTCAAANVSFVWRLHRCHRVLHSALQCVLQCRVSEFACATLQQYIYDFAHPIHNIHFLTPYSSCKHNIRLSDTLRILWNLFTPFTCHMTF